jgi:uncharacterized protein (TIGR00251 family)
MRPYPVYNKLLASYRKMAVLEITVSPKSSKQRILVDKEHHIKAYLTAPPAEGKANAELIGLMSKILKIPKYKISIISGAKNRKKQLRFEGVSTEELLLRFQSRPGGDSYTG